MSGLVLQTMRSHLAPLFHREQRYPRPDGLRPWSDHLPILAQRAQLVIDRIGKPQTINGLTLRYIVMDLLDLLAELGTINQSPLFVYGEFCKSFDTQFKYAWHDLTECLFRDRSKQSRHVYLWAKSIYDQRQFALTDNNLFEGMSLWDIQPAIMVGPSPITWDMAVPRLMAYSFTDQTWELTHQVSLRYEAYDIMKEFTTIPLPPAAQCGVLLKRIKYLGLKHLESLLYPDTGLPCTEIAAARYAWMQMCMYYALIRGKLDRLGCWEQPLDVQEAIHALDTALAHHIKYLSIEDPV